MILNSLELFKINCGQIAAEVNLFRPFSDNRGMKAAAAVMGTGEAPAQMIPMEFGNWMLAEQRRIYLLCLKVLRNPDEADSATQDVFFAAFKALEKPNGEPIQEPAKWLTRVALNTCYDCLRSKRWKFWQKRASGEDEETVFRQRPAAGLSPEEVLIGREIHSRIRASLHRLSAKQRMVFVLRFEEEYSLSEISEALGLDLGTVKAHMARAVKKLREELRGLYVGQAL
jgi:RNA polymerase sigma-70 factor, ECF subfamily